MSKQYRVTNNPEEMSAAALESGAASELVKVRLPKCPYCKAEIRPVKFDGYYDGFYCWKCDCTDIPGAVEERGNYA